MKTNNNARYILGYLVLSEYFTYKLDDTFDLVITIKISESQQIGFNLNKLISQFEGYYFADCYYSEVDLKSPSVKLYFKSRNYTTL